MPDRTILVEAAEALACHQWASLPDSAHGEHHFDSACKVCRGDTEAMTAVVLGTVEQRLRGEATRILSVEAVPVHAGAAYLTAAADLIAAGLPDAAHTRKDQP